MKAQPCSTLCNPMDFSPPGSSVHGILQARILEWIAIPFSRGSSRPRDRTWSPTLQAYSLPSEPSGKLKVKEGWAPKNWCFQIVVLENTLESPLDFKEIKPVNPKGNQPWIFMGRTGAESEALILWPPDAKSQLIGKDLDAGKDWRQEEKGATEYKMVR